MKSKLLLLEGTSKDLLWIETLRHTSSQLNQTLVIKSITNLNQILNWNEFSAVVIEDEITPDLPEKIRQIRKMNSETRIIIFSSAPGWKEATSVMRAGAIDYARKSSKEDEILKTLKRNLTKTPPVMG